MLIIKNPTKSDVRIVIDGDAYEVMAAGQVTVRDAVALKWKKVHEFLQVAEVPTTVKAAEVVTEKVEPTKKTK